MKKTLYLVLAACHMMATVSCGKQESTTSTPTGTETEQTPTNPNPEADKYDSLYDAFLNGDGQYGADCVCDEFQYLLHFSSSTVIFVL